MFKKMVGKTKYLNQVILPSTGKVLETFRNKMTADIWAKKRRVVYMEILEVKQIEKENE
jgi:hypothetical protein